MSNTLDAFSDMLTQDYSVKNVATSLTIPLATITSMLSKVASHQSVDKAILATVTDPYVATSIEQQVLMAQATINYYSALRDIATATTSVDASYYTQVAQASAAIESMFADIAFFGGHYPSSGGNVALAAVFVVVIVCQIILGVFFHQWWFLFCWICGLVLEILGYFGRIWLHYDLMSFNPYIIQIVCLTLAPCFLLAGMYYILAQLAHIYGEHYSVLRPMIYCYIFIACDTVSICLQGAGGGLSSGDLSSNLGVNLTIAGLAFQVFTMVVFQALWYMFIRNIIAAYKAKGDNAFNPDFVHIRARGVKYQIALMAAVSISLILIFIRSIYRLVEMGFGYGSTLADTEIYFMFFEGLLMSLSCVLMTVCHPGLMYGRRSHIHIDKKYKGFLPAQSYSGEEEDYELDEGKKYDERVYL